MSNLKNAPESKNVVDMTGATPANNFDKFMISLLMGIGVIPDLNQQKRDYLDARRGEEEYTRQQRESYARGNRTPQPQQKEAPIFPELDVLWKRIHGK